GVDGHPDPGDLPHPHPRAVLADARARCADRLLARRAGGRDRAALLRRRPLARLRDAAAHRVGGAVGNRPGLSRLRGGDQALGDGTAAGCDRLTRGPGAGSVAMAGLAGLAPRAGLEPATSRLTADCSTN